MRTGTVPVRDPNGAGKEKNQVRQSGQKTAPVKNPHSPQGLS